MIIFFSKNISIVYKKRFFLNYFNIHDVTLALALKNEMKKYTQAREELSVINHFLLLKLKH